MAVGSFIILVATSLFFAAIVGHPTFADGFDAVWAGGGVAGVLLGTPLCGVSSGIAFVEILIHLLLGIAGLMVPDEYSDSSGGAAYPAHGRFGSG